MNLHSPPLHPAAEDPALSDPALLRKLKANREESMSRLEQVISKFAIKQEDTEEQERNKRQQKVVRGARRLSVCLNRLLLLLGGKR